MISLQAQVITLSPSPRSHPKARTLQNLEKCSTMAELRQIHSQFIRLGLSGNNYVAGRIIKFCSLSSTGDVGYARKVFDEMPHPDAFIYNTIMKGYLMCQLPGDCIALYMEMILDSVVPNSFTFPCVIRACSVESGFREGRQIHAHVVKFGFGGDGFSLNNLIFMYMSFGLVEDARRVFDMMPQRNDVSWTTLISGYSQCGLVDDAYEAFISMGERSCASWSAMISALVQHNRFQEAFELFDCMRSENVELDRFIVTSMLTACTSLGALETGEWIHGYIKKSEMELDMKLAAAIIDMYCKCGCLQKALEVFNGVPSRGISSWNCMIGGLALHGKGKAAIDLFKEMEKGMLAPDEITFLNLLNACSHSELVNEGRYYFQYMTEVYGIEPRMEHFGCMASLLGRAGLLEEARELIEEMPVPADASVLGALVGACKIHGENAIGDDIGKQLIELDPDNSGRYVLVANLYASAGRWEDAAKVRRLMDDRGVKKAPGFSRIELGGVVNEFVAEERYHSEIREINAKVEEMMERIRCIGYRPDVEALLHDVDDEYKESALNYHSEKLAIAFGLMKTVTGETIRITKNLRVCADCHKASKYISKAYDRVIIMRDRNRFHHFKNGECSCNDYW